MHFPSAQAVCPFLGNTEPVMMAIKGTMGELHRKFFGDINLFCPFSNLGTSSG